MLSLAQARKIDPSLEDVSDEELLGILEALYAFGRVALDTWSTKQHVSNNPLGVQTEAVAPGMLHRT